MRKIHWLLAFALVIALGRPALAGKTVEVVKIKGQSLVASFSSNLTVCASGINSAVDVQWNSTVIKTTGSPPTPSSTAFLTIRYVDTCSGDDLTFTGAVDNVNGSVNGDLSKGHFDGVIAVATDPDTGPQPQRFAQIHVSLNFTGSGAVTKIRDRSKSRDGAVTIINDLTISSRPASATGSVSGTLPLNTGNKFVNLISGPSVQASIGKDASGTITITRKTK
jgi:hypothetical protein